jgi:hypothetical protein
VTRDDIARRRLRNEPLVGAPFASAVDVVRWLFANHWSPSTAWSSAAGGAFPASAA